jgi:hypothetical protein
MALNMNLLQLFKASIHNPKKIAAFRLIPIGKVMQYIFIFIFLLTIISFVQFINGISVQQSSMEGLLEYFEDIQWLLYPFAFVFLFVLNTLFSFIQVSIFAYIGTFILYIMKRRGDYRHLWRTALFASTVSMILSLVVAIIQLEIGYIQITIYAITLVYLVLACRFYPIKK